MQAFWGGKIVKARNSSGGYNGRVNFGMRDARREDFDQLWRIDQACFSPELAYSRLELAVFMKRRGAFTLVAEEPGAGKSAARVLGFLVAEGNSKGVGHVITIDVIAEARRAGVGSALLDGCEKKLRANKQQLVFLETPEDNAAAIAFYKRHGYDELKTVPGYYANGMGAVVMRKKLAAA